jgi:MoxR-like ATPase
VVVLTSNRERDISDGLKRRCVYLFIDYPTVEKEVRILQVKAPEAGERLSNEVARAVNLIRANEGIGKKPAISESIDWARALVALGADSLNQESVKQTLNIVLKNKEDIETIVREVGARALAAAQKA